MLRSVNALAGTLVAVSATITSYAALEGAKVGSGFFMLGLGLIVLSVALGLMHSGTPRGRAETGVRPARHPLPPGATEFLAPWHDAHRLSP